MYTHPGAKLLFMGNEFAQTSEWNFARELDWKLLKYAPHEKMQKCVKKLNELYTSTPALYEYQFDNNGFEWIDLNNRNECVIAYKRKGKKKKDDVLVIFNMTPIERHNWKIEVSGKSSWTQIFCSNDVEFWGSGIFSNQKIESNILNVKTKLYEISLNLPPLTALVLQ